MLLTCTVWLNSSVSSATTELQLTRMDGRVRTDGTIGWSGWGFEGLLNDIAFTKDGLGLVSGATGPPVASRDRRQPIVAFRT